MEEKINLSSAGLGYLLDCRCMLHIKATDYGVSSSESVTFVLDENGNKIPIDKATAEQIHHYMPGLYGVTGNILTTDSKKTYVKLEEIINNK